MAPVKCVPVIVTDGPPDGPEVVPRLVTLGASTKVNRSSEDVADVPEGFVTVMWLEPTLPAGAVATMVVESRAVKSVKRVAGRRPLALRESPAAWPARRSR